VLNANPLNGSFRQALVGNKLMEWHNLVARVAHINLNDNNNKFIWLLNRNGTFSVNSMYRYLINNGVKIMQEIWRMKVPIKIKFSFGSLRKE
jgi:phage-related holin